MDDEISRAALARKGTPYLGVKQACFYLGLSPKTLQRLRVNGGGPAFRKLGATVRYHVDDLKAWCDAETITKLPPRTPGKSA
jgi:excisionase family DNA binding protein